MSPGVRVNDGVTVSPGVGVVVAVPWKGVIVAVPWKVRAGVWLGVGRPGDDGGVAVVVARGAKVAENDARGRVGVGAFATTARSCPPPQPTQSAMLATARIARTARCRRARGLTSRSRMIGPLSEAN
jgi:hypothetical protein